MYAKKSGFLPPVRENIPKELKSYNQWLCWKNEPGLNGKPTKVPYNPKTLRRASTTNPKTWGDFNTAMACYDSNGFDGIGFVLTENDPFAGFDFDKCRIAETGEIKPSVKSYIDRLSSYTEDSPSATGIRAFAKATFPPKGRKKGKFEVYDRGRYLTITGHHLPGTPKTIEPRQAETADIHSRIFNSAKDPKSDETLQSIMKEMLDDIIKENSFHQPHGSDDEILQKAIQSKHGEKIKALFDGDFSKYPSRSEADLALCFYLALWFNCDSNRIDAAFRRSGLMRPKWNDKHYSDGRT